MSRIMSGSMAQSQAFINNVGQWPEYNDYQKLDENINQIRLLQLQGNLEGEGLKYTLGHASLLSPEKYSALSYYWGPPVADDKLKSITIGKNSVRIRPRLHSFLCTLAKHRPEERIWLDVICINQNDVGERSHQVSMMGNIYRSAQKVYAWLGIADDDTDYALQHTIPSTAKTPFYPQTLSLCVEQIFQRPYWTRRWVIQEFALAPEVWIVCGEQICKWEMLIHKINDLSFISPIVQAKSENFQRTRELQSGNNKSLFNLMLDFRQSRCVDSRDKAYALRALAADGSLLTPDYAKSSADVYFGVLSLLPTEKVLPEMRGYRWPHQAASQLQTCMELTMKDFFGSLAGDTNDRLYTVFEYTGRIATVQKAPEKEPQGMSQANVYAYFPFEVRLQDSSAGFLHGNGDLKSGDIVYSLQSTPNSPKGLFIAFRSTFDNPAVVGTLTSYATAEVKSYWAEMKISFEKMKLIERISLHGIVRCFRNMAARTTEGRLLCHVNRLALILFWLLDLRQLDHLGAHYTELWNGPFKGNLLCDCPVRNDTSKSTSVDCQKDRGSYLEILPSFHPGPAQEEADNPWIASSSDICSDMGLQSSNVQYRTNGGSHWEPEPIDFYTHGRTELSYAAGDGHILFTNTLLTESAVNSRDDNNQTPLSWASRNGHDAVVKLLAGRNDVEIDSKDKELWTPLWWAAFNKHEKVVQVLLDIGKADSSSTDKDGYTPLSWAAFRGFEKMVQVLLNTQKIDPNSLDENSRTPLLCAVLNGQEKIVQILLEIGKVNLDFSDKSDFTPLSLAAAKGHEKIVQILLESGKVDPNFSNMFGRTPLSSAAAKGQEKIVQILLESGKVDPNFSNKFGYTPLSSAVSNGQEKIVQILLESGKVDPNLPDKFGHTLLSLAVSNGQEKMVQILLENGKVDPNSPDNVGCTPLSLAVSKGHEKIVQILLENGKVDPNFPNMFGSTPLSSAVSNGQEKMVQILLESGKVDPNSSNKSGDTPLSLAVAKGHEKIVQILLESGKVGYIPLS